MLQAVADDELESAEDSTAHSATDLQPSLSQLPENDQEETVESQSRTKRAVSKHEHEEFVDLFGEASDEEVLDESGDAAGVTVRSADTDSDDDDVVEVMVEEKEHEPVIDLTAETSSDEEYVTASQFDTEDTTTAAVAESVSQVSIKNEKLHDKEIKNNKKSKHRSKHKQSTKDKCDKQSSSKEKNSERQSKSSSSGSGSSHKQSSHRGRSAAGLPVVSATSEADQCKELFEMFQRCEQPAEPPNSVVQVRLNDMIRPTCHVMAE